MRYAARRTWPERSKTWEYLGEADSIEDFALDFATAQQLAADDELVVIEKEGAESDIQFYRVTRSSPYSLLPAEPRVPSQSKAPQQAPAVDANANVPATPPRVYPIRAFIAFTTYTMKVLVFAFGVGISLILIISWFQQ